MNEVPSYVIGGGMTGLAAGIATGWPVLEATSVPGGICSSYYMRPGDDEVLTSAPKDGEAYRFEIGGGHWIFGGDPAVLRYIDGLAATLPYERRAGIYLPATGRIVPYPIQNHLHAFPMDVRQRALADIFGAGRLDAPTMDAWLRQAFGKTLHDLFFHPFHALYTAGLSSEIAPQDPYKNPLDRMLVLRGAMDQTPPVGYNTTFVYPREGLDVLARRMAQASDVRYEARVVAINPEDRVLFLEDGRTLRYARLLSTLPLSVAMLQSSTYVAERPDPSTGVLVLNIGARRGWRSITDQWLYVPSSRAGFHRIGVYSNVDAHFLPASSQVAGDHVSLYVERAFRTGDVVDGVEAYARAVVAELQEWGFIGEAEVVHATKIATAYTWAWPGSTWRRAALAALDRRGLHQVGRYARWTFFGIAESIRDGFVAGTAAR